MQYVQVMQQTRVQDKIGHYGTWEIGVVNVAKRGGAEPLVVVDKNKLEVTVQLDFLFQGRVKIHPLSAVCHGGRPFLKGAVGKNLGEEVRVVGEDVTSFGDKVPLFEVDF